MTERLTPEQWAAEMTRRCDASEATASDIIAEAMEQAWAEGRQSEARRFMDCAGPFQTLDGPPVALRRPANPYARTTTTTDDGSST